jgi:flagellar hook-associated protein 1 FlgK
MSSFFPQGTFFGLDLMSTSLESFSVAENVTSDNIANVNTPGASRQQVDFTEQQPLVGSPFMATNVPGTAGQGIIVQQIQRIHDNAYDSMFRGASASQNYYQTEQQTLQPLQSQFGDPNAGISTMYTAFQTSIQQLVDQGSGGSSTSARAGVLTQAQNLANALSSAGNSVVSAEASVLQQGGTLVTTVNGILDQIAALNGQIRASTAVGDNPNTFADQRDYLIDQLSQYVSTQTSIQSDGSTLVTVNGQALVNDTVAYHLAAPTVGTAANGAPTFKINFATTPPASASTPGIPLGSGQLAALQDLYNNKLAVYKSQLDSYASSLANETNRITQASYDANGQPGTALFIPIVASLPISSSNIKVGITDPSQLPIALANTNAGTLVVPLNSANNTVDTSAQITNNNSLANPPAAALNGNLTITVDGITSTFAYNTGAGGNADTINDFITNFNAGQYGVTASFDTSSQQIVFARDPNNESLTLRGLQATAGGTAETPDFTLNDSLFNAGPPATAANGYLLGVLGAGAINNVDQNQTNAYAADDNGGANALVNLFQSNVGVPALESVSGLPATAAGASITVALPAGVTTVQTGQVLTIADPGGANQENVTVTSVSYNAAGVESVTFTAKNAHAANFTIASAQVQTLQQYYNQFVTQVGIDTQTATTGNTTQTNLATNIDSQRQSIDGINIDEETQNLIKYQNAYSAAAKTISTLNTLLGTIINGLGVGQ